ncbi:MAG: hypothetical protein KF724_06065 [Phycisphaeraceae bacterium]|nr:hypothetical protein [Phycisphaeraceae bacterium]
MIPRILSGACVLAMGLAAATQAQVKINEIRVEQPGPDFDEYVELKGPPGTNLAGYFYIVIGNDDFQLPPAQNGYVEEVIALSGTIPASGLFVIAKPSFTLGTANLVVPFTFEGGNNKTHLLVQGFTGNVGDDLDANNDGVLDPPAPWSSVSDSIALIQFPNPDGIFGDFVYSTTTIGPDAGVIPSHVWRCGDTEEWRLGFFVVGITDTPGVANPECAGAPSPVLISEIRIDQPGGDNEEYFELSGTPGASLDDLTYIVIGDGAAALGSGVIECVVPLKGFSINAAGLFLVAENTNVFGAIPDYVTAGGISGNVLNFENVDNVTHMLVRNFTGQNGDDLDLNNDGVLDITPWDEIVDWVSVIITPLNPGDTPPAGTEWYYSPTVVGPDGPFQPGHVYRCQPNGDWRIGSFDPFFPDAADTPGATNLTCEACGVIGSGNCFLANGTPGCQDESCCNLVCDADPTCCDIAWDASCVLTAKSLCHAPGSPPAIKINEVRIANSGSSQQYVELKGPPGASLNGVAYVVIGSSVNDPAGVVESYTPLKGSTITASGYFVFAKSSFNLAPANLVLPANGFQFGSNGNKTHLLVWNPETLRGEDLDSENDCELDRPGWVSIIDQLALVGLSTTECVYAEPLLGPDGAFLPAHFYRCPDTDEWFVGVFGNFEKDTPGEENDTCKVIEDPREVTLAQWTFEATQPNNAGPHAAEGGLYGGPALGIHANPATAWSSPVGNGSSRAFSSNTWSLNDVYQFTTSTLDHESIEFQWSQTRSTTGPADFVLEWRADSEEWTPLQSYTVPNLTWSGNPAFFQSGSVFGPVALPASAADRTEISVRLRAAFETAPPATGTNRVDDIIVTGIPFTPKNPCPADLSGDGSVGGADVAIVLGSWGPVPPGTPADLNGDGVVNGADIAILLGAWGACP